VRDVCADARKADIQQEADQIKAATEKYGVKFFKLPDNEMKILIKEANSVHEKFAPEINKLYEGDKYKQENFLKEVQNYMNYKQ